MTELHYNGLYISVSGGYVSATGAVSRVKDLVDGMNGRGLPEPTVVKLIKDEMKKRGYGNSTEESR
jgi:predicted choloylglycine hydrolase